MSESIYAVAIPKWGIEMENGTITNWHSEVGDTVTKGDELADIESDKIVNTLEATATGVLRRRFVEADDQSNVGELIGIIAAQDVSDDAIEAFIVDYNASMLKSQQAEKPAPAPPAPQAAPIAPSPDVNQSASGKVRVSPPVRRKAEALGVDLASVVGTGPGGRISSEDVERAASGDSIVSNSDEAQSGDDAVDGNYTSTKLTSTQQTIGRRLVESKQSVPHFYLSIDIELDQLLAKREGINEEQDQRVSINDLIVWSVARALMAVPEINAQLVKDEVRQFKHADISVAVATERGLLTPIVGGADQMTPAEVSTSIAQLIDKAKNGGLERSDIVGGSFTVSNLGMFGVKSFDAIINPPQVAILALGRAQKQVVVRDDDKTEVVTIVSANLSSDHRVVDGALGGRFLSALKKEIESL